MRRTTRIKQIEHILMEHPDGLRVRELSELCAVDRRTIYRDLEAMQDLGIPLRQVQGKYAIERDRYFTSLNLNLNEVFTLLWGMRLLRHNAEVDNPHAWTLVKKAIEALPPDVAKQVEAIRQASPLKPTNKRLWQVLEALTRAWADSLKVVIYYHSTQQPRPTPRVISPYILETSPQGKLYVIALDEASREIRIFNLKRITRAEVLEDEPFRRTQNFDLSQYVLAAHDMTDSDDLQTVVLRFDPHATNQLKDKQWYPTQRLEFLEDGGCLFIVEVQEWHELENWVRSWGVQVEVLAPSSFRRAIAAEFRQAAKLYG